MRTPFFTTVLAAILLALFATGPTWASTDKKFDLIEDTAKLGAKPDTATAAGVLVCFTSHDAIITVNGVKTTIPGAKDRFDAAPDKAKFLNELTGIKATAPPNACDKCKQQTYITSDRSKAGPLYANVLNGDNAFDSGINYNFGYSMNAPPGEHATAHNVIASRNIYMFAYRV